MKNICGNENKMLDEKIKLAENIINTKSNIRLLNIDCMDYMKTCKDNAFDLAIVDPPYGIKADNNGGRGGTKRGKSACESKTYLQKDWDSKAPTKDYFNELFRVSKNQIIWGANFMVCNLQPSSGWIVWDKNNGNNRYSDCELAYSSFNKGLRKFKYTWHGMIQENMRDKEERIHPTQKPVALYRWLLDNYAEEGQKILDTHLGSGSSAIAAYYYDCDFVGCEIDKDYFNLMDKRFKNKTSQGSLFKRFTERV